MVLRTKGDAMKCKNCNADIANDRGGQTYVQLSEHELIYGEFNVYPFESSRAIFCSVECLQNWLKTGGEET